jgi:hypothetical protein
MVTGPLLTLNDGQQQPVASIRYGDGSVREVPFTQARLADFAGSVPWRRLRSVRGQAHYSGSYASATTGGHVLYERRLELVGCCWPSFPPKNLCAL